MIKSVKPMSDSVPSMNEEYIQFTVSRIAKVFAMVTTLLGIIVEQ